MGNIVFKLMRKKKKVDREWEEAPENLCAFRLQNSKTSKTAHTHTHTHTYIYKGKGLPQEAEVAQGVPGKLRPRIFLMFGTMRVVGRQPYAPATFTPGKSLSLPQGTWFCR